MNGIKTNRLCIRKITHKDANALSKVLADPIVMKYSTVGVHSKEQIKAYINNCQKQYEQKQYGRWAIYESTNTAFVGICGLNEDELDSKKIIHINYRLAIHQQGKGYAIETTRALLGYAKNTLKLKAVHALIEPENIGSVNVANRTGFELIKSSNFRGFKIDVYQVTF
ncbi:GNAT family N-acetyltransferase [Thalassotalea atypica]|uniref:GNAT family N-acetyltransferase n=1 Tax=Thalassotalea atypica TaxID=2054316 RepID=UPI002572F722|nr:GNAT family N-acetyltransferase [Thalassotalea atypica]